MDPGEGSGSNQHSVEPNAFTQLDDKIRPLLEQVGESQRCMDIRARKLRPDSPAFGQPITNVRGQYNNLVLAYVDLSAASKGFNEALNHYLNKANQNPVKISFGLVKICFYLVMKTDS
uniref:Uncharacterized protein n=1 Tax=Meloidogyne enterolobii TaxID=390850 RepID=A0A6V7TNY3_MELEN|nr:unnamed protein product [Meloidogyne enterolobii]